MLREKYDSRKLHTDDEWMEIAVSAINMVNGARDMMGILEGDADVNRAIILR